MAVTMSTVHTKCNEILTRLTDLAAEANAQMGTDGRKTSVNSDIERARATVESIRESFRSHVYQ